MSTYPFFNLYNSIHRQFLPVLMEKGGREKNPVVPVFTIR